MTLRSGKKRKWVDYDSSVSSQSDNEVDDTNEHEMESEPAQCSPPIVGAGLSNLGNTCFMNSVLQCFSHTVPLLMVLVSDKHIIPSHVHGDEQFCVLCALLEHLNLSFNPMGNVVAPWKLVDELKYFGAEFQKYEQQDAHEFMSKFMDKLGECWNKLKGSSSEAIDIVRHVFGGRLLSRATCPNCQHRSDTYEDSVDLSLPIEEDVFSLNDALNAFFTEEKLGESETIVCGNCMQRVASVKRVILDQAPCVAAIHLKRFESDGRSVKKIDKKVSFPLELDLCRHTAAGHEGPPLKYVLYAVVKHVGGTPYVGHYYSYIRSSPQMWYKFNDDQVTLVDENLVLSEEAYILIYAKEDTSCFASFYETQNNPFCIPVLNAGTSSSSLPSQCQNDGHETNYVADKACTVTDESENVENCMRDLTSLTVGNLANDTPTSP